MTLDRANPVGPAVACLSSRIAEFSSRLGRRVEVHPRQVIDRSDALSLRPPGLWSPNRSCRLVQAADGWIAVNLARASDVDLIPAWLGRAAGRPPWEVVRRGARGRPWRRLVDEARVLGLPVAGVGEVRADGLAAPILRMAAGAPRRGRLQVIDLTSLWAGPLCGALLAAAGAAVTRIESVARADPMRTGAPGFYARLNGGKAFQSLDFAEPAQLERLADLIGQADVVITSARPRAFAQLGIAPEAMFARNPGLTWVAISGYGWVGADADRVAFGDDAAAAGGLVRWTADGAPRFVGDALADPLAGLAAAAGAMAAVLAGGGALVDAAMARTAAGAAALAARTGAR